MIRKLLHWWTAGVADRAPGRLVPAEDGAERISWVAATLFYAAIAVVFIVYPVGHRLGSVLLGTVWFPHDAILNAGILEWGYRSLWSTDRHVFQWIAGFPLENSLALTENLIGWQWLYTPLRAAGVGTVGTYNVLLVASFLISGLTAMALARHLGADRYGAWVAGLIFAFTPFHLVNALPRVRDLTPFLTRIPGVFSLAIRDRICYVSSHRIMPAVDPIV